MFLTDTKKDQRGKLLILFALYGAPGRIRTSDTLIRSQVLYPAELQALIFAAPYTSPDVSNVMDGDWTNGASHRGREYTAEI